VITAPDHSYCSCLYAGVLFHANLLVDISFLVDLGLQPFMGFWDEHRDVWVMDLAAIRARYLRGWATVDLIAGCPYDVISVLVQDHWIGRLQVHIWITTLIQHEGCSCCLRVLMLITVCSSYACCALQN
jgi:hypothetical protein